MNSDVLKSLGYLKKSLGMTNRAIFNAIQRDPANDIPDKVQDLINDLIKEIGVLESSAHSPAMVISPLVNQGVVPIVPTSTGTIPSDDSGSGINFLDPS